MRPFPTAAVAFAFALVLALPGIATAQPEPGLELVGTDGSTRALTQSTHVDIRVTGLLARTTVTQRFTNHTGRWTEGRYVFPLPDGASVDELEIRIGERLIEGEIREKRAARERFETARRQGQSAGLVEQHRANLFSTSITNIAPGEQVEVTIGFGQTVAYEHGRFSLHFPTTTLPRFANAAVQASNPEPSEPLPAAAFDAASRPRLSLNVELDAGIALATVQSLHHPVRIDGSGSVRRIELARPEQAAGRDFELTWTARGEDELQGALFIEELSGEQMRGYAHALLMLVPPAEFRPAALRRELILVIDRSGSMNGEAFEQAREAIRLALDRVGRDDRFNVIAFSSSASPLFDAPVEASPGNLNQAYRFIGRLDADGGTQIDGALAHAMGGLPDPGYLRQIVFATDGAVANEKQVLELIGREIADSRLFSIGIGHGVNDAFLARAARLGHGSMTRIADPRDIGARMGELLHQLESPVLEDIQLDWPVAAETWPEHIPDLYAGQPLMVLTRLEAPVNQLDSGTIRATGFHDLKFVEMEWPLKHFNSAPGVARAWARARIQGLSERRPEDMDSQLRDDEMLLTALDYRIVSRQTSLVAVDRTPRRTLGAGLERVAVGGALPADRNGEALVAMPATDGGSFEAGLRGLSILALVLLIVFNRRFNKLESARDGHWAHSGDDGGADGGTETGSEQ